MLFNSYGFVFLFLPLTLLVYWQTRSLDGKKAVSLLASYIFYGVWSIKFAGLMLATTSVDYYTARRIDASESPGRRRSWLVLSMVANMGTLALFKYYDFFARSLDAVLPGHWLPLLDVALPIGISFYTFESMSYTIDVYRRKTQPCRRYLDYAHFVTMFPRLVAGPIVRYTDLTTQLQQLPARLGGERFVEAMHFFTVGMAKKVIVADTLARTLVDPLFASADQLTLVTGWAAALAYTGQLYFDFSGYSDMAVGLGLLLGLRLPRNFDRPYSAASIAEFWRRWHISLSTWLRDYLFIPLGGSRGTRLATARNLFLTMLLGGLWHGANWTFVLWGAYHGLGLCAYNLGLARARWLPRSGAILVTFLFVVVGWVLFRAANVSQATAVYRAMAGWNGLGWQWGLAHWRMLVVVVVALAAAMWRDTYDLPPARTVRWSIATACLLAFCVTQLAVESPFLYFQF